MKKSEVIVLSIVIGFIVSSLIGYYFGEELYLTSDGSSRTDKHNGYYHFQPNYLLGLMSLVISSGVTFLVSNRLIKKAA